MMSIDCPSCGPRNQDEFVYGGQAHLRRPDSPEHVSDESWAHYQYIRENPRGLHLERWRHLYGCGQWFHVARDTLSHEILAYYDINEEGIDEEPPEKPT